MLLAEFTKSVRAFDRTVPGRVCSLALAVFRLSYAELHHVFRSFSDVLQGFELAGQQERSRFFDELSVLLRRLRCLLDERSIVNLHGHIRVAIWKSPRRVRLPG